MEKLRREEDFGNGEEEQQYEDKSNRSTISVHTHVVKVVEYP